MKLPSYNLPRSGYLPQFLLSVGLLFLACARPAPEPGRYLVGAYYYSWYPRNFQTRKFLRRFLEPPQIPVLGYYSSADVSVAERHIAWCSQYGIDFLALDWWPSRPQQNRVITEAFIKASNIGDIKFCIFYETQGLGRDRATGTITFTEGMSKRFVDEMVKLADGFFNHPSYLKIGGRPVIILYLTRNFRGDYRGAIERLRAVLKGKGHDPYIIGDEVFWVVESGGEGGEKRTSPRSRGSSSSTR